MVNADVKPTRSPDSRPGMESWVTRDYGGTGKALVMSKAVLGLFVYHLLRLGGGIESTYALRGDCDRSYVQFAIYIPAGKAEELQSATGIALERPSRLVLA